MQTYMVGGAVRDALLGLPVNDRDWVVVGATPHEMIVAGYLPVGKDFPVFLHPETREEHALARTERKTARGYHGFAFHAEPDVTLEQDLARRDLTINAMAQGDDGVLIDPFDGRADLRARLLRHVTQAFREDPVRILRVARFAARFADFSVAPQTQDLMREMVLAGEVDALVAERVWQELARGLMEGKPSRMIEVLRDCGALARLLPELAPLAQAALLRVLDTSADAAAPLPVRFACMTMLLDAAPLRALCERLRVPTECRELAEVAAREHVAIGESAAFDAGGVLNLLERCDAIRKPQRFERVLQACECEVRARPGGAGANPLVASQRLLAALRAALGVATAEIAAQAKRLDLQGPAVGEMIHRAREQAVAGALSRPHPGAGRLT
jgi:tRNA nucleotidyltransferase (CCA-adding enzyme)